MLPLNYAILKLFEDGGEYDVAEVMSALAGEYGSYRAFTHFAVNESLMSAEKNGLLEESRFELNSDVPDGAPTALWVFYKATDYGLEMIRRYI